MIDDRARTLRPSRTAPAWARSRSGTSGHLVASGAHHVPQRAEGVEALAVLLPGLGVAGVVVQRVLVVGDLGAAVGALDRAQQRGLDAAARLGRAAALVGRPGRGAGAAARATSATSGRRGNPVPPRSAFLMTTQTLTSTPPSESKSVTGSGTTTRLPQTRRAPSRSGQADSTQLVEFGGGRSCQCIWGPIGG